MSDPTYTRPGEKPLVWLHGEIRTPPFSKRARIEAGALLRRLQLGERIGMPDSRPMPDLRARCHELRVRDDDRSWRIVYRVDADAVVLVAIFAQKSRTTPRAVLATCGRRLRAYDEVVGRSE